MALPRPSTFCEVEMLTTASITFSATSAMFSGPRACAELDAAGTSMTVAATAANAARRIEVTSSVMTPSIDLISPRALPAKRTPVRSWEARPNSCGLGAATLRRSGKGRKCGAATSAVKNGLRRNSGFGPTAAAHASADRPRN
jgi:hypothetical protein